jgi:hypothetical protein
VIVVAEEGGRFELGMGKTHGSRVCRDIAEMLDHINMDK